MRCSLEKPEISYARLVSMIRFLQKQKNPDRAMIARLKADATAARQLVDDARAEADLKAYAAWATAK